MEAGEPLGTGLSKNLGHSWWNEHEQ